MSKQLFCSIIGLILAGSVLAACGSPAPTATPEAVPSTAAVKSTGPTAAEGKLLPLESATLSFNTSGEVTELLVKEGDVVKAGDVIARLRHDSLQAALAEAEAALAVVKANEANYRSSLPKQIAAAEAEIKAAQSQAASASAGRNTNASIKDAESQLAQARYAQQQAESTHNLFYEYKLTGSSHFKLVEMAYNSAIQATQAAEAQLAALKAGSPTDRAAGAQISAAAASRAAAEARLTQLQAELDGKATDVFAAQVQQSEAAISAAKLAVADTELTAPFGGTIADLNLKLGEQATAGAPAVTLADISGWLIETSDVTELKIPDLKVGQAATIKIDALPELTLKGQIESISDVSQLKSGDVVYPVKIKLVDSDPQLRWGMTVAVTFEK